MHIKSRNIFHAFYFLMLLICTSCGVQRISVSTLQGESPCSSDSLFARYLQKTSTPITQKNEVVLLKSGQEKFNHLFRDIEKAGHFIHLEYFNFRNDSIARELFMRLADKTSQGIKVRTLFDAFGNMSNNQPLRKKHLDSLRQKGIEIETFDPIKFPYVNHVWSRDHQKIAVIDGIVGYTGGMNVADYYIKGLPEIGEWRDMHIRIKGPAVEKLQEAFLYSWNKETKQHLDEKDFFPYTNNNSDTLKTNGKAQVAIVQRVPKKAPASIRHAYIAAIDAAQHKIQIINPYFTPTISIRKAIRRAIRRGVRVEIMIPGKSDIPFTPDAALYIANKLRKKGAHVYIYNGGFHHSKVMMVDERFCTVGSANLNSRSLRYDYEINAFILDLPVTAELNEIFAADKQNSTILTKDEYKNRSVWKRFVGWFAHLFTPVL